MGGKGSGRKEILGESERYERKKSAQNALYKDRRAKGLCTECGDVAAVQLRKGLAKGHLCAKHQEKSHARTLKRTYGLTEGQLAFLNSLRIEGCMICGKEEDPWYPLAIDHDHATGQVRGLLCMRCNVNLDWVLRFKTEFNAYGKETFNG